MAVGKIQVQIVGDTKGLSNALGDAEKKTSKLGSTLGTLTKGALIGGAVGGVALLSKGLVDSVGAAKDAQQAQIRLEGALKNANISYKDHGAQIDSAIQKTSKLAALDDEDLSDAFAKFISQGVGVKKATEDMGLAADIARARNISLEAATKLVEKANIGSATAFKRIGVAVKPVTEHMDALKAKVRDLKDSMKGATDEQKKTIQAQIDLVSSGAKAAAQQDKEATSVLALAEAHKRFAGAAEDYGKSAAGAQERFGVALENLEESIGKVFLPMLTKLSMWGAEFLEWSTANWPKFQKAVENAFEDVKPTIQAVIDIAKELANQIDKHWAFIERNMQAVKQVTQDAMKIITAALKLVIDLIHGDWSKAWEDIKQIVSAAFDSLKTIFIAAAENLKGYALAVGKAILNGIKEGLTGLGEVLLNAINGLKEMLANQVDNIRDKAVSFGRGILNGFKDGVTGIGEFLLGVVNDLKTMVTNQVGNVLAAATALGKGIYNGIVAGATGIGKWVLDGISNIVSGIAGMAGSVFAAAKSFGSQILSGIGSGLASFGQKLGEWITAPINAVIGRINGVISAINGLEIHIPAVDTHVPGVGKIGGQTIGVPDLPHIPQIATGGQILQTGLAIVHRGETVVPANRSGVGTTVNVTVNGYVGNDQDIAARLVDAINSNQRQGRMRFAFQ